MPTNLSIDDALLKRAQKLGKHATKRQTVDEAECDVLRMRRSHGLASLVRHAFAGPRSACARPPATMPNGAASLIERELNMTPSLVLLCHD